VNLGNPVEFTILELATMVKELTRSKSEIVFLPLPQDDPVRRRPDIALAKARLHWEADDPLRDGPHPHDRLFQVAFRASL